MPDSWPSVHPSPSATDRPGQAEDLSRTAGNAEDPQPSGWGSVSPELPGDAGTTWFQDRYRYEEPMFLERSTATQRVLLREPEAVSVRLLALPQLLL